MTIVELLVVLAIQMAILGAVATLYVFTLAQSGQAMSVVGPLQQIDDVLDAMTETTRQSMTCTVVTKNGMEGIRCTRPANGIDTVGDGTPDEMVPDKFDAQGKATYTKGKRVWYYLADSTGTFGNVGTILWRATRNDDSNPTAADADKAWAYYYNSKPRYTLIDSLDFTVAPGLAYTTVTLIASASHRKFDSTGASEAAVDKETVFMTQTMPWRTDFE